MANAVTGVGAKRFSLWLKAVLVVGLFAGGVVIADSCQWEDLPTPAPEIEESHNRYLSILEPSRVLYDVVTCGCVADIAIYGEFSSPPYQLVDTSGYGVEGIDFIEYSWKFNSSFTVESTSGGPNGYTVTTNEVYKTGDDPLTEVFISIVYLHPQDCGYSMNIDITSWCAQQMVIQVVGGQLFTIHGSASDVHLSQSLECADECSNPQPQFILLE